MDLADVASYFDEDPVYDGYTGTLLFYCHTTPHDDSTSSGATSRRRTMTTTEDTAAPARAVVTLYEDQWLVSNSHIDTFLGSTMRRSYSLKRSTGAMSLLTPGEACLSSAGTTFYAHREYFRDNANAKSESEWDVMWNIFHAPAEAVLKGSFLRQAGVLYRVRTDYPTVEDLSVAKADQLDGDALQAATFTTLGTLNIVTDTPATISTATTVIQTDPQKFYRFRTLEEGTLEPGDRTVFVAKSVITPKPGTNLDMQGAEWRVVAVVSEADAWACLVRLV